MQWDLPEKINCVLNALMFKLGSCMWIFFVVLVHLRKLSHVYVSATHLMLQIFTRVCIALKSYDRFTRVIGKCLKILDINLYWA